MTVHVLFEDGPYDGEIWSFENPDPVLRLPYEPGRSAVYQRNGPLVEMPPLRGNSATYRFVTYKESAKSLETPLGKDG